MSLGIIVIKDSVALTNFSTSLENTDEEGGQWHNKCTTVSVSVSQKVHLASGSAYLEIIVLRGKHYARS